MSYKDWKNLSRYDLHKTLISQYLSVASDIKGNASKTKTDFDVIRENHKFLWEDSDLKKLDTWEKRLAKKYYDKLYKEYCIADLSRYKENKFGMRWRTEEELVSGRGQFSCGNKKCKSSEGLRSWEVNFGYIENGEKRNALVKLRLCPECSHKLNYHHKKKEVKRLKNKEKKKKKKKQDRVRDEASNSKCDNLESDDGDRRQYADGVTEECDSSGVGDDSNIWKSKDSVDEEKSREEEFEEYLEDLFL